MATTKSTPKSKMTDAEIDKNIKKMKEAAQNHQKSLKKGENFVALDEEELRKKLQRVNSPVINSMGWSPVAPGGTVNISVGIFNPDPVSQSSLYLHLWVGSGNTVSDNALFLLNVDARFPRLAQPPAFGATLAPGGSQTFTFPFKVPSTIEPSTYLCNFVLLRLSSFDVGTVFDRSGLALTVT
jgi:hypothetical protein